MTTERDSYWMRRAIELAKTGLGTTSPNPMVGALVVDSDQSVGQGAHRHAGGPHAETQAIQQAGARARGATLYVTLEPCNHTGATPPCTDSIIAAGISRVVYATRDTHAAVSGGGHERLVGAGIEVTHGVLESESRDLNRAWFHFVETGVPWVIAKYAASLDGRIATRTGDSRWITGEAAREHAHRLRAEVDAVLVGSGTALTDDPALSVRLEGHSGRHPRPVVLDARGRTPASARLFRNGRAIVMTTDTAPLAVRDAWKASGADVVLVAPGVRGGVHVAEALAALGQRGIQSVLVEGGGQVLGSFFDARSVNEAALFLAPLIIGGRNALPAVAGDGPATLSRGFRLLAPQVAQCDGDLFVRGTIVTPDSS